MTPRTTETPSGFLGGELLASLRTINGEAVGTWLRREWQWLLVGAAFVLACWSPVRLSWNDNWKWGYHPLVFAPLMPLAAALILWSRRADLQTAYRRSRTAPPRFWLRGNSVPLALGCILLLFASFVQVKGFAFFGLLLIAVGVVYRVYGWAVLRAALPAFVPLALTVPPPDSFIDGLVQRILSASVSVSALVLNQLHQPATALAMRLRLENTGTLVEYTRGCSAFAVALPAVVLLLCLLLTRRARFGLALSLLTVCGLLSLVVSVVRIIAIGYLAAAHPDVSRWLNEVSVWPFVLLALGSTLLVWRGVERARNPVGVPVQQMATGLGRGANALTNPLLRLLGGLGQVGKLWGRSERGIEKMLTRLSPKSKKRRRGGW